MLMKPCVECGELSEAARCAEHRTRTPRPSTTARGYDSAWHRLSVRARRMQPFCSDCGTADDLTVDHTPEAWQRRDAGLPITLDVVAVVCRSCNSKRGKARGEGVERPDVDPRTRHSLSHRSESVQ